METLTRCKIGGATRLEAVVAKFTKAIIRAFKKPCRKRISKVGRKPSCWDLDLDVPRKKSWRLQRARKSGNG